MKSFVQLPFGFQHRLLRSCLGTTEKVGRIEYVFVKMDMPELPGFYLRFLGQGFFSECPDGSLGPLPQGAPLQKWPTAQEY